MKIPIPNGACCLGCGYALRGLPEAVCPECGRAFDPGNSTTFVLERDLRRRRRKRVGVVVAALGLLGAFAPRGIMTSTVTLTCPDCKAVYRTARHELRPPGWLRAGYPAICLPLVEHKEKPHENCLNHRYDVSVTLQSRVVIRASGSASGDPGDVCEVVGFPAIPKNARKMIDSMIRQNGLSVGCCPPPFE